MAAAGLLVVSLRVQPHGHCRKETQQPAEENLSLDPDLLPLPVPAENIRVQFSSSNNRPTAVIALDIYMGQNV